MSVIERLTDIAIKNAKTSNASKFQMAAVAYRSGGVIAIGVNDRQKSHPRAKNPTKKIHAELALVLNASARGVDLTNTKVLIIRLSQLGTITMAKPCKPCEQVLITAGVKKVYYSDRLGKVREMSLGG